MPTCFARPNSACPQTSEVYRHAHQVNVVGVVFVIAGCTLALLLLIALVYHRYYGKTAQAKKYRRTHRRH